MQAYIHRQLWAVFDRFSISAYERFLLSQCGTEAPAQAEAAGGAANGKGVSDSAVVRWWRQSSQMWATDLQTVMDSFWKTKGKYQLTGTMPRNSEVADCAEMPCHEPEEAGGSRSRLSALCACCCAGLLEVLDMLGALRPMSAPILIVHEVQSLLRLGPRGEEMLTHLLESSAGFKERVRTPLIFETSDSLWLANTWRLHNAKGNSAAFKRYEVGTMERAEGETALVQNWRLLTQQQFEQVWHRTGGQGEPFADILRELVVMSRIQNVTMPLSAEHQYLLDRIVEDIVPAKKQHALQQLQVVKDTQWSDPPLFDACLEVLLHLRLRQWRLPLPDLVKSPAVRFLISNNVLYYRVGYDEQEEDPFVRVPHAAMQRALDTWLDEQLIQLRKLEPVGKQWHAPDEASSPTSSPTHNAAAVSALAPS
jgi:hypothetical protein